MGGVGAELAEGLDDDEGEAGRRLAQVAEELLEAGPLAARIGVGFGVEEGGGGGEAVGFAVAEEVGVLLNERGGGERRGAVAVPIRAAGRAGEAEVSDGAHAWRVWRRGGERLRDAQYASTSGAFDGAEAAPGAGDEDGGDGEAAGVADAAGDVGDHLRAAAPALLVVEGEVVGGERVAAELDEAGEFVDLLLRVEALAVEGGLVVLPEAEGGAAELGEPFAGALRLGGVGAGAPFVVLQGRQALALAVELALEFFEGAVVGDGARVEALVGDFDAALGSLDDGARFADGGVSLALQVVLGVDFRVERREMRKVRDLVEDGLKLALGGVALEVEVLELGHAVEVHKTLLNCSECSGEMRAVHV